MTVYAERVFALNAGLNFLLLLGSARLAGAPAPMRRVLPAAAVGGVYAVAALVPALGFFADGGDEGGRGGAHAAARLRRA